MPSLEFDFVVIGGGTSGLVLTSRLTEDPNTTVLVIEAGKDHTDDPRVNIPGAWHTMLGDTSVDWALNTVPQAGAIQGYRSRAIC